MHPPRRPLHETRYYISNWFEFRFCVHEKVISGRLEISSVQFPCKIRLVHWKQIWRWKVAWKTNCWIHYYLQFPRQPVLLTKLIILLIKRKNFQAKQNQFFINQLFIFWRISANRHLCFFQVNSLKHLEKNRSKNKVTETH